MPACCRCQHCHGRRDDDARVKGRDEVADPTVQHVDRIGRKGGESRLGPGLELRDGLQPAILQNACGDHDEGHAAEAGRPLQLTHRGADVDPLVRGRLDRPVDPRPSVQPVINRDLRLAGGIEQYHRRHLVAVQRGELPGNHPSVGVADKHIRRAGMDHLKQSVQLPGLRGAGKGADGCRADVTEPVPGPIVGTHPGVLCQRGEDQPDRRC